MITITAIKPKGKVIDAAKIMAGVTRGYERTAELVLRDFQAVTRTWKTRPRFVIRIKRDGFSVRTDNEIFKFVDQGTRPHRINPKRPGGRLRFSVPGSPKTVPGVIGSGAGRQGGDTVYSRGVDHPGTKARDFTGQIQAKFDKLAPVIIQDEVNKAVG